MSKDLKSVVSDLQSNYYWKFRRYPSQSVLDDRNRHWLFLNVTQLKQRVNFVYLWEAAHSKLVILNQSSFKVIPFHLKFLLWAMNYWKNNHIFQNWISLKHCVIRKVLIPPLLFHLDYLYWWYFFDIIEFNVINEHPK